MAHHGEGETGGLWAPSMGQEEEVTLQEVALKNLDVRDKMWNVCECASHS